MDNNSNKVGCKEQMGEPDVMMGGDGKKGSDKVLTGPTREKKKKKHVGLGKKKKKVTKKKRKELEAQESTTQPSAPKNMSLSRTIQLNARVVRSSFTKYKSSSSTTMSHKEGGSNSHVESIGDSGIMMGNNRFDRELENLKAEKLWRLAKENLGVSIEVENDALYIEKIKDMEARDKMAQGKKEKTQSSK